jgi:hypothetical protein
MKSKVRLGVEAPDTWLTPIRWLEHQTDPYCCTWYLFRCRCGKEKRIRYAAVYNATGIQMAPGHGSMLSRSCRLTPAANLYLEKNQDDKIIINTGMCRNFWNP